MTITPDISASRLFTVHRVTPQEPGGRAETDHIATETPVALVFNGISHAVMMATPEELEVFALGFALSEGLLLSSSECHDIEVQAHAGGCVVQLEVSAAAEMRIKTRRRSLAGRTGCGLCGIDSLDHLDLHPTPLAVPDWARHLQPAAVLRAFTQLPALQPLSSVTGACHAAAWANPHGDVVDVKEDVGRHNALDKLLGARARTRQAFDDGFVVMSSRASYELVRKCARLGVPALAVISAPTTLAIDIAQQAGLQLYGFCRGERAVLYAGTAPG